LLGYGSVKNRKILYALYLSQNQLDFIINVHATALKIHHKLLHQNKAPVPTGFEATTNRIYAQMG
jgi:hypothetical protein